MAGSWYRFSLHGADILAPITEAEAACLQADGIGLEPVAEPEARRLAEHLAPVVAIHTGGSRRSTHEIVGYA